MNILKIYLKETFHGSDANITLNLNTFAYATAPYRLNLIFHYYTPKYLFSGDESIKHLNA